MFAKSFSITLLVAFVASPFSYAKSSNTLRPRIGVKNRLQVVKKMRWAENRGKDSVQLNRDRFASVDDRRRILILKLTRLLSLSKSGPNHLEIGLRLGRLFREEAMSQMVAPSRAPASTKKRERTNAVQAQATRTRAVTVLSDLARQYPKSDRADEVLYFLALSLQESGKPARATAVYEKLAQKFPKSRFFSEAMIEIGDYHFSKNQFQKPVKYYESVTQRGDGPLLPYARYRLAWCYYNQGRFREAISLFQSSVEDERRIGKTAVSIRGEAIKDVLLPYVELSASVEALAYLESLGEVELRQGLETLAPLFLHKGERRLAVNLWARLLELQPEHPKAPSIELQRAEALALDNRHDDSVELLSRALSTYFVETKWKDSQTVEPKRMVAQLAELEEGARVRANNLHAVGEQMRSEPHLTRALKLYEAYLSALPNHANSAIVRFQLAGIYFLRDQKGISAELYEAAYHGLSSEPKKGAALLAAIACRETLIPKRDYTEADGHAARSSLEGEAEEQTEVADLHPEEKRFLSLVELAIRHYPKEKVLPRLRFRSAFVHFTRGDFGMAREQFTDLIKRYPKHPLAEGAAFQILEILGKKRDFIEMIRAAKGFLGALGNERFKRDVGSVLRRAELKRIEGIQNRGEHVSAAEAYLAFIETYGAQEPALEEKALFNAGANFFSGKRFADAVRTRETLLKKFPKSKLRREAQLEIGRLQESLGNLPKAAQAYLSFADDYPKHEMAATTLRLAALYFWGSGRPKEGRRLIERAIAQYPAERRNLEGDLEVMLELSFGARERLQYHQQRLNDRTRPAEGFMHALKIIELVGPNSTTGARAFREAQEIHPRARRSLKKMPGGDVAEARFLSLLANGTENRLRALTLGGRKGASESVLQQKVKLLRQFERELRRVVVIGDSDSALAALYRLAAQYRGLISEVLAAPVPAGLSAKDTETYHAEVQKKLVAPFSEKTLQVTSECLKIGRDAEAYSPWLVKCYSLASSVDPEMYPPARTYFLPAVRPALVSPSGEENRELASESIALQLPALGVGTVEFPALRQPLSLVSVEGETELAPQGFDYREEAKRRRAELLSWAESKFGERARRNPKFDDLAKFRLVDPKETIRLIVREIAKEPESLALHNLLALTEAESGSLVTARVRYLSLVARGFGDNPAIQNNLGVIEMLHGRREQAFAHYLKAASGSNSVPALSNLGFLALQVRNGSEARAQFSALLSLDDEDVIGRAGLALAQIQNGEFETGGRELSSLYDAEKDSFLLALSAAFLLDVSGDASAALGLLAEAGSDRRFERLVREATRAAAVASQQTLDEQDKIE